MLRTPPQCLSLQNVNLLFYSNGNHVGNILTYYIHSNTLWNSILPLCQSSFYTAGMWGDVVKHNVLPKAQTLCECTHRLQGFFFILYLYLFFFKRTIQKKAENTRVLCALCFEALVCVSFYICRLVEVQISAGNLFQVTGAFNGSWVCLGNY